ncbi:aminopeptidase N [Demequina zhanjiangensis]|uniref:Aminopeptidase N n=1 Tax=Demequina zhanjiangensis TaxID=3051659 RepID=A0ABT8G1U0_9MICO|nr:aminopeptidase N [Demequina sp. SYSU T00b26]MDN4472972.1 aminopeptidase N [Demequina sp. SYSU T00b26]
MAGLNLTKIEAAERATVVSHASYSVELDFTLPGDTFGSRTTLTFDAADETSTFLDLVADSVTRVEVDGAEQDLNAVVSEGRLALTQVSSRTVVVVEALMPYRTDGQGVHRFVDPETGETYLYTQFAANDARSAFACFDQPDIKGTFAFTVDAPAHWVVVSNSPEPTPVVVDGATTEVCPTGTTAVHRWTFAPTVPLPCYVAAVMAGPYASAGGTLTSQKGEISARVYGRAQLADHLDADELLGVVQSGLELYERMFGTPYPYEKYDQLFVPEYNLGAMENVGAVTISEDRLLFRSRPSDAEREARQNVVLHELAHMWFGNLVTMRWWDDLWLNESFAEFVGTWATEKVTEFTDSWVTFGANRKSVAYVQDQLPTTHAIVTEVPDTEATVSAFDMITYAKGASALKQLAAYVGEDAFFTGVASYLTTYAYGNATLAEFLAEVENAAGRSLDAWAHAWLETPGVPTLRTELTEAADGTIGSLAVVEDPAPAFPVAHPHRLSVAGYAHADGHFTRLWDAEVAVEEGSAPVEAAAGRPLPDLLLANDGDRTYAKLHLTERTIRTASDHIADLTEAKPQALVLDALWHMCRDGQLPAARYIDAALTALPVMANSTAAEAHARTLVAALTRYAPPAQAQELGREAAERLWTAVDSAAPSSDLQLQLLKAYAQVARTDAQAARLSALLSGELALDGLTIDTDLSWALVQSLAAAGAIDEAGIDAHLATDDTAAGRRRAAGAKAAISTIEAKRAAWNALAHPEGAALNNATQYEVGLGLARVNDPALLTELAPVLLDELLDYYLENEGFVGARVARYVFPVATVGRVEGVDAQVEAWLEAHPDAPSVLRKVVIESLDEMRRALLAQSV